MHQRAPLNEHRALNPPENHDIVLLFIGSMVQRSQAIIIEKDVVDPARSITRESHLLLPLQTMKCRFKVRKSMI